MKMSQRKLSCNQTNVQVDVSPTTPHKGVPVTKCFVFHQHANRIFQKNLECKKTVVRTPDLWVVLHTRQSPVEDVVRLVPRRHLVSRHALCVRRRLHRVSRLNRE